MSEQTVKQVRFGASWSTQLRLVQAIGKGLAELTRLDATIAIGERSADRLHSGELDLVFTKSVVNEHQYQGKGYFAGAEPARWLRTIAWLPQEDRYLYAVAPWTGITSFEDIAERKPALQLVGRVVPSLLKEYGFSYDDVERWGGRIRTSEYTARAARAFYDQGQLDAWFGDGSGYDATCWRWMAERGYTFLDIRPDVMERLEQNYGLRRNITVAGFLPGITRTLLAVDDSHIVLSCHERLDEELAYLLAKVIDERSREIECESIQVTYGDPTPLPLTQPTNWSSLTDHIAHQWDSRILCAPLHPGAERYYRERGVL